MTVCGVTVCPSQDTREIGDPNTFKTRLKCICHEIALSVTRQTCTLNCSELGSNFATPPACYRSLSGPSARSVRECPSGCLWGRRPRAPECARSVAGVSPECQKGVRTLRGHSRDTLGTLFGHSGARGPKGPRDTLRDTPRDTPGTLRARRAQETPVAGRGGVANLIRSGH